MSDFFEDPENLRLLQKVQLKKQSGMDIKKDTIQLIAAAFDSMTDEDWVEYERHQKHFDEFYQKYKTQLSDFSLTAIHQLVQQLLNIIPEISVCGGETQSDYHDLVLHITCEIMNQNDVCKQIPEYDVATLNNILPPEPETREEYCHILSELCSEYLQTQDFEQAGIILVKLYVYSSYFIYT